MPYTGNFHDIFSLTEICIFLAIYGHGVLGAISTGRGCIFCWKNGFGYFCCKCWVEGLINGKLKTCCLCLMVLDI